MHFDIRPTRYGTVEVRICDSTNLRELSAAVALTHCLIVDLERKLDRGEELPTLQDWHVAENKWRAARYGMDAEIIISRDTDEAWVTDELRALVERLSPLARELGCYDELQGVLTICQTGASYQRQRSIYKETGSWLPVVDAVLAEM